MIANVYFHIYVVQNCENINQLIREYQVQRKNLHELKQKEDGIIVEESEKGREQHA